MAADVPGTIPVQLVEQPRLQKLKEMFISKFGSAPKFYVRAPGRVNLIEMHPQSFEQLVVIHWQTEETPLHCI